MNKHVFRLGVLSVLVCLLGFVELRYGSVEISGSSFWQALLRQAGADDAYRLIIWEGRMPRMILAIVAGAGLSVSGLLMQTLFRNPMAGPYVLGISSGAGLGVALMTMGVSILGIHAIYGWTVALSGVAGAFLIMFVLLMAASRIADNVTVLVLGILIGGISSAFVSLMQYFSPDAELKRFVMWTLGSLETVNASEVSFIVVVLLTGITASFFMFPGLNALLFGENAAKNLGVNTKKIRYLAITLTALMAGVITAFCGPIGFVGIIVPHIARMVCKVDDHKILIPASCLMGAFVLLLADLVAHVPGSFIVLPLNAITSVFGIPILVWIILKNKQISASFS